MTARTKAPKLVRYVSPYGSPAWMSREQAQRHLVEDDRRWIEAAEIKAETGCEIRSAQMLAVGAPRIEVHAG